MCCGKKRNLVRRTNSRKGISKNKDIDHSATQPRLKIDSNYFQYLGTKGLTIVGPRTHKQYRFTNPGAVVAVDPRDKHSLTAVSILRQVSKPANVTTKS